MNLFDHRLAAILQIRTVLAARMFELRDLRRRVQTAQLNPRRRRRARSKTALFKSLDAKSIGRPQRVGLARGRAPVRAAFGRPIDLASSDLKSAVLNALAFVVLGLVGLSEHAAAVRGVQTFERQGRF